MKYKAYTKKVVEFQETDPDLCRDFYGLYGIDLGSEPGDNGWINFRCVLPTHSSSNKKPDGAICLKNMHYKCWSNQCRDEYNEELTRIAKDDPKYSRRRDLEWISAAEFLMLHQELSWIDAQKTVDDFIYSWKMDKSGEKPEKMHLDNHTNKKFVSSMEWENSAIEMQEALQKNLHSDILLTYINSKGLKLETILAAKMGYIPASMIQKDECLVHVYYQNGTVVAIKGRTADGRKGGVKNSSNTLYLLQDLQRAISLEVSTLILCEGETDTLVMKQALKDYGFGDIPVCGIPGSNFNREWSRFLRYFTRIIFIRQSDAPSKTLGAKIVDALDGREIEIVEPPFEPMAEGKDIADYFMLGEEKRLFFLELLGLSTENLVEYKTPLMETCDIFCQNSGKEIKWVIPNFIESESINHIIGPPKVGKTFLALQLMISASYGVPLLDNPLWESEGGFKSLLIEEEGSRVRLSNRFKKILYSYKLEPNESMCLVHRKGIKLDTQEGINTLRKLICKEKPNLLIFDPLASLHSGDENDAKAMSLITCNLNSLLKIHRNMAIVVLHHSRKKGPKEAGSPVFRGSTVIFASSDLKITLEAKTSKEDGDYIEMTLEGREVEGNNIFDVTFNGDTGRHYMKDLFVPTLLSQQEQRLSKDQLLDLFLENPTTWYTSKELQSLLKLTQSIVSKYTKKLMDDYYIMSEIVPDTKNTLAYKLKC